jgi:hypothetical protein
MSHQQFNKIWCAAGLQPFRTWTTPRSETFVHPDIVIILRPPSLIFLHLRDDRK